jgi:DNA-binding CsgD family transcriptional regulator
VLRPTRSIPVRLRCCSVALALLFTIVGGASVAAPADVGAGADPRRCTSLVAAADIPPDDILFGYTPDARPVSHSEVIRGNPTGRVLGFCGQLHDYLDDYLPAQGQRLTPCEVLFDERFGVLGTALGGRAAILCGPTSLTPAREAALTHPDAGFTAEISRPFVITSTKLLVRRAGAPMLEQGPRDLRIGLLKPRPGLVPVTTEVIEQAFPNARFVGLRNRTEAVQALALPVAADAAIDAYASDEVMLVDMLRHDLPAAGVRSEAYAVLPPFYGYSREEYVVVAYNAPGLMDEVERWLDAPAGTQAARELLPQRNPLLGLASWIAWRHHAPWLGWALLGLGGLLVLALAWLLWRRRGSRGRRPSEAARPSRPEAPAPPATSGAETSPAGNDAEVPAPFPALTQRERQVLDGLVQGCSNKEVARRLGIEVRTVETHRRNIYTKLGVKNTAELVKVAVEREAAAPVEQPGGDNGGAA